MSRTKKKTRAFKDSNCSYCKLADKRALKNGWPCCGYTNKTGKDPDISNGHCVQRQPIKKQPAK